MAKKKLSPAEIQGVWNGTPPADALADEPVETFTEEEEAALADARIWERRGHGTPSADADTELLAEARATTMTMTAADLAETALVNQMVGITSYARALDSLNKVTLLKALQSIKDSKSYKTMVIARPDGSIIKPKTWAGLCEALGLSRSKMDEDLENLAAFGEKLLEEQKNLGIGYRELRALRGGMAALPEERQLEIKELIADAAESNDKEVILATLDEIGARNKKLTAERDDAQAEAAALKKQRDEKSRKANDLEVKLERALNPASIDERQQNLAAARLAFRNSIDSMCVKVLGEFMFLCGTISNAMKADTEETHGFGENMLCFDTWDYVNNSVSTLFAEQRSLTLGVPLDVRFPAESSFAPITGMHGDPGDFSPGEHETQQ